MVLSRALATLVIAYVFLALGMLRWHFSYGPPYYQTTFALLVVFAVAAAVVGLLSVWAALGILHWAKRASVFFVAVSVLTGLWLLFFEWNQYLIWQCVVLLVIQLASLVLILGVCRVVGFAVRQYRSNTKQIRKNAQMSIRDLLLLTASLGTLCAVLRTGHPVELGTTLYTILLAGGLCAAFTALTAFWLSFSKVNLVLRLLAFALISPLGGGVYLIASNYMPLLFNWQWYAGVTVLQMLLMMFPFAIARAYGVAFTSDEQPTSEMLTTSATGWGV